MTTAKCQICKQGEREWAYMPFFSDGAHFTGPKQAGKLDAMHLAICEECKRRIERGVRVEFTFQRSRYVVNDVWLSGMERVEFVREAGTLEPEGTHLLIADDPDWDVMMCGATIRDSDQERLGQNSITVGDLCTACLEEFVQQIQHQREDKDLHRARAI